MAFLYSHDTLVLALGVAAGINPFRGMLAFPVAWEHFLSYNIAFHVHENTTKMPVISTRDAVLNLYKKVMR